MPDQTSKQLIFILGAPRSGTSLLLNTLLRDQPQITGTSWESFLFNRMGAGNSVKEAAEDPYFKELLRDEPDSSLIDSSKDIPDLFRKTVQKRLEVTQASVFVEKSPIHTLWHKEIAKVFPEGKWILIKRDPLAAVHSIAKTRNHFFSLAVDKLPEKLATWAPLRYWNAAARYFVYFFAIQKIEKSSPCILTVEYEKLISDPEGTRVQLSRALGVELSPLKASRAFSHKGPGEQGGGFQAKYKDAYKSDMPKWAQIFCRLAFLPAKGLQWIPKLWAWNLMLPFALLKWTLNKVRGQRS